MKLSKNLLNFSVIVFFSILLYILTFPNFDLSYGDGIDAPLVWVYNFLLKHHFEFTKTIFFPHGPLAFLTYPLAENLGLFFVADFSVKALFIYLLYVVNLKIHKSKNWIAIFVISYLLFLLSNITYVLIFEILLAFVIAKKTNKSIFKYLGFFLIAFAFYIKSYSCSIGCILGILYLIDSLYHTKNIKQFILDGLTLIGLVLFFWLLFYHTFYGFVNYCIGIFNLIQDNSSAAALYPENNWIYLALSFSIVLFIAFFNCDKKTLFYRCASIIIVFAAFKHGMAREDITHIWGFWVFLFIHYLLFLFYIRRKILLNSILSITSLCLLYLNFNYKGNYYIQPQYNFLAANNFIDFISNYQDKLQKSKEETLKNINYRKVSNRLLKEIGNSTVDVYPWDYSIIAANNFNWHPRPVIQSYAAYTSWLDWQNMTYFKSKDAPEFLIWDFTKGLNPNIDESNLSSIDGRFLLNDEPNTFLEILSNYEFYSSEKNVNIYKKRKSPILYKLKKFPQINQKMNQWIAAPTISNQSSLRVKVDFKNSMLQLLKKTFYKDEQYWIYLKVSDESIHKYRIVPKNAKDGVWLNPLIFQPFSNKPLSVKEIMFKASNQFILCEDINIQFESVFFNHSSNYISNFFRTTIIQMDTTHFEHTQSFEELKDTIGISWEEQKVLGNQGLNKSKAFALAPESFSPTYNITLDTCNILEIKSSCWVNPRGTNFYNKLSYVFVLEDKFGKTLEWNSLNVGDQILNTNDWNLCSHYFKYPYHKDAIKLKVFLWNTSKDSIYLDDFYLKINKNINGY